MCVNTMPKHINGDLKEEIVAARDFWKDYTSPSFCCEKDYSQIETFSTVQSLPRKVTSQQIHCKVRLCDAQTHCKKAKSYISDCRPRLVKHLKSKTIQLEKD